MGGLSESEKLKGGIGKVTNDIGNFARERSTRIVDKSNEVFESTKELAVDAVEKITAKKQDPYEEAIAEYNDAHVMMNDKGLALHGQRERSADLIVFIEQLVNSIANTPKEFERTFSAIDLQRAEFLDAQKYTRRDLEETRKSAVGAAAGIGASAAVVSLAPTGAMWAATTFGTASTGTAISTLTGAAANSAAIAWLGGGTVAVGGGGMVAGNALLAMAGPIGWSIAGTSILAAVALKTKKKLESRKDQQKATLAIKENVARINRLDKEIGDLLERTSLLREQLSEAYSQSLPLFGADFLAMSEEERSQLAALVNNTKACGSQLSQQLDQVDYEA